MSSGSDLFATDLRTGELLKHGARVRLQGQPIQVLGVLLERPGELVTREELRARLWGSETFVDFEHGLHAAVNKLRAALNDSADDPSYIETIPRRGYRFVGSIETSTEVDSAGGPLGVRPGSDPTPREQLRSAFASARILVAAALVTVAIVALIATRKTASRPSSTPNGRPMLAVLPFENLSGNADQEYFSDGLTEELITALGQLDSARLGVIARTSVMGYKRTVKKVRDIGRELGVEYVLGGSVRHDDERVRISVQLVRASDETDLWAHSYDKSIRDLLPVQAEIANAIAGELRLRLPGQDGTVGSLARHVKWEAYEAALRGRYFLERRTAEGIPQGPRVLQSRDRRRTHVCTRLRRARRRAYPGGDIRRRPGERIDGIRAGSDTQGHGARRPGRCGARLARRHPHRARLGLDRRGARVQTRARAEPQLRVRPHPIRRIPVVSWPLRAGHRRSEARTPAGSAVGRHQLARRTDPLSGASI